MTTLFDNLPRTRRTDPPSSARAEQQMKASGAMTGQRKAAYELVKAYPGRTSKELAALGELDRYQLARRLPELLMMGQVRRVESDESDCRWFVTD